MDLPKFINNQQAVRPIKYACNFVWIGPHPIPLKGVCNLYTQAKNYTGNYGQFIPTLFLDAEAIFQLDKSNITMLLIKLEDCPEEFKHMQIAATQLVQCKFLLKIDLYGGQDVVYMPAIIIETLYDILKLKLREVKFNIEICNFDELSVNPEYFQEDNMFVYLVTEVINDLYDKKLYIQASDLIRLLVLVVQPGCYVDISDIEMSRLPCNSDFPLKFMTHNRENYLIVSLNQHIMINILCSMYLQIRVNKNISKISDIMNKNILIMPNIVNLNTEIHAVIVKLFNKNAEKFIIKGITLNEYNFPKIAKYLYHYQEYQEFFVNHVAGFKGWTAVVNIIQNFVKLRYEINQEKLNIPQEVFPNPGAENQKTYFSYRNPLKGFKDRILFLGEKINYSEENALCVKSKCVDDAYECNKYNNLLIKKEIDNIAKNYAVVDKNRYKIIMLAMLSYALKQGQYTNLFEGKNNYYKLVDQFKEIKEIKLLTQEIMFKAKYKEQELYELSSRECLAEENKCNLLSKPTVLKPSF